jgi:hypothetical protein
MSSDTTTAKDTLANKKQLLLTTSATKYTLSFSILTFIGWREERGYEMKTCNEVDKRPETGMEMYAELNTASATTRYGVCMYV